MLSISGDVGHGRLWKSASGKRQNHRKLNSAQFSSPIGIRLCCPTLWDGACLNRHGSLKRVKLCIQWGISCNMKVWHYLNSSQAWIIGTCLNNDIGKGEGVDSSEQNEEWSECSGVVLYYYYTTY